MSLLRIVLNFRMIVFITCLIVSGQCYAKSEPSSRFIGAGFGATYGLVGVKLGYQVSNHISLMASMGTVPAVGLQYLFRDQSVLWRPKLSIVYGYVSQSIMQKGRDENREEITQYFRGTSIEIGQAFQFGTNRNKWLDFSITYPLTLGGHEKWKMKKEAEGYNDNIGVNFGALFAIFNLGFNITF